MSKESNNSKKSGGIGFLGLLTLLFIALKLTRNIDWSWFWVLSPIGVPLSILLSVLVACGVVAVFKK